MPGGRTPHSVLPNPQEMGTCTNQLNVMNNSLFNPVLAVVMGTGLGMLLSVAGQKMINAHALDNCWRTPTRQLVYIHLFQGDAWYCVDKKYLN